MRSGPGTSNSKVGLLPPGTEVLILSFAVVNGPYTWHQIQYPGVPGSMGRGRIPGQNRFGDANSGPSATSSPTRTADLGASVTVSHGDPYGDGASDRNIDPHRDRSSDSDADRSRSRRPRADHLVA